MITIQLKAEVCDIIKGACRRAGLRETGGMLFGEHVSENEFCIVEATVAGTGTVSSFTRAIISGLGRLELFFRRTNHDYRRFNYLGEWHSHPSFEPYPSASDDKTMFDIVNDPITNARFALLLIVKLNEQKLETRSFVYYPNDKRHDDRVVLVQK